MRIPIDDLYVTVYYGDGPKVLPVTSSPVYEYLEFLNDDIYNNYHKLVREKYNPDDRHTLEGFADLCQSVLNEGVKELIKVRRIGGYWVVTDGQHRLAILKFFNVCQDVECGTN